MMNSPDHIPENSSLSDIPVPDQLALDHSATLSNRIKNEIQKNGFIRFSRYMDMALYEPGLGYYSAGARKFGKAGDFITAPEISPVFTRCLARQCHQILREFGNSVILEAGAGSGVMMCDLLQTLEEWHAVPGCYFVLEPSADLKSRQLQLVRERIPHHEENIIWLDRLPDKPFDGIIIGNEVLDAMPVHRLLLKDHQFHELCVNISDDEFGWVLQSPEQSLLIQTENVLDNFIPVLPDGYKTELNDQVGPWITSLSECLDHGAIILIDYGYPRHEFYHPQRTDGTLICHYRHRAHNNPFLYPGLQDITASVDFTLLAESAMEANMQVRGYTTQAHFLINCGLEQEVSAGDNANSAMARAETGRQIRILTMPGEMGEKFKVIALTRNLDLPLMGFRNFDQRHRL